MIGSANKKIERDRRVFVFLRSLPDDVGFAVVGFGDDLFDSGGELGDEGRGDGVVSLDVDALAWGERGQEEVQGEEIGNGFDGWFDNVPVSGVFGKEDDVGFIATQSPISTVFIPYFSIFFLNFEFQGDINRF